MIWFCRPPGSDPDPGRASRPLFPGNPGQAAASANRFDLRIRLHPGRTEIMAAKPKPENADEAREQARRALQTSMDTRQ